MIKRVIKIETTKEMVANDINELITGSDIDQEPLGCLLYTSRCV